MEEGINGCCLSNMFLSESEKNKTILWTPDFIFKIGNTIKNGDASMFWLVSQCSDWSPTLAWLVSHWSDWSLTLVWLVILQSFPEALVHFLAITHFSSFHSFSVFYLFCHHQPHLLLFLVTSLQTLGSGFPPWQVDTAKVLQFSQHPLTKADRAFVFFSLLIRLGYKLGPCRVCSQSEIC